MNTITIPDVALSIRQPWAYAVAMGWKPVENRSWHNFNPGCRFRGQFAIHASGGMTRDEYESAASLFAQLGFTCPPAAALERGGIIGVGRVINFVGKRSLLGADSARWFFGPRALVIADAQPVPFIPVSGQLGFFKWRRGEGGPLPPAKWMIKDDRQRGLYGAD